MTTLLFTMMWNGGLVIDAKRSKCSLAKRRRPIAYRSRSSELLGDSGVTFIRTSWTPRTLAMRSNSSPALSRSGVTCPTMVTTPSSMRPSM